MSLSWSTTVTWSTSSAISHTRTRPRTHPQTHPRTRLSLLLLAILSYEPTKVAHKRIHELICVLATNSLTDPPVTSWSSASELWAHEPHSLGNTLQRTVAVCSSVSQRVTTSSSVLLLLPLPMPDMRFWRVLLKVHSLCRETVFITSCTNLGLWIALSVIALPFCVERDLSLLQNRTDVWLCVALLGIALWEALRRGATCLTHPLQVQHQRIYIVKIGEVDMTKVVCFLASNWWVNY